MNHIINQGIRVAYTDDGEGMALVFIHAFPLSKAMWQPQVKALAGSYRIITLDLRGHGESDAPIWNWSLEDYAADVIAILDSLGIAQAVFIGLSMGGYTLFSLYRQCPDRIQGMILADTRAQADTEDGKAGRRTMAQVAFKNGASAIADMILPKLLAPTTLERHPELAEQVRRIALSTPQAGIIVDLMAMAARPDSLDLLKTITCPTLVIVGEQDQATPVADSQAIVQRIPAATLVTIPQAGHLSNFEQPEAFNEAIRSFLKTHKF